MTVLSRLLMLVLLGGVFAMAPTVVASAAVTAPATSAPYQGTLTAPEATVAVGTSITFSYSVPAAGVTSTNWVGIYEPGQTPGTDASTTYQYTPDASGTVTFSTSALDGVGNYVAYFFYDNGYQIIAGPVSFSVTPGTLAPAPLYQRAIGAHQLTAPSGVAAAANGDIWATDTGRNRVTEFDASGRSLRTIGAGLGLNQPEGIALGPAGSVWVADTGSDRIVELSAAGRLVTSFGGKGSGNAQLDQPVALALSPTAGTVYVADQNNNRIEEFTAAGGYAGSISVPTPAGVAVDGAGDIWVSSPSYASGNQVYEFSPTGAQLLSFGSTQASYGALGNTGGIAIGPDGKVYVAQSDRGRPRSPARRAPRARRRADHRPVAGRAAAGRGRSLGPPRVPAPAGPFRPRTRLRHPGRA